MALLFASCSWAHHAAVDLSEFAEFVRVVRSSTSRLPDRRRLRSDQLALAQQLRSRVVHQLRNYCRSCPLSVAIDGWTNVNTAKVTNVVIVCGGVAYYWCSIVNSRDRNTAAWLSEPLLRVLDGIKHEGLVYSALVADNEAVNGALWARLREPLPFLIRSPCAAHIIQLCVHKALALPVINPILAAVESLLRQFKPKAQRTALISVQIAKLDADAAANIANNVQSTGRKKEALVLLHPCDTRWSSLLFAAERLLRLKPFVELVLPQDALFWTQLADLQRFLKAFQEATDVMQRDCSTLYDVYEQFMMLLLHVRTLKQDSAIYAAKDDILNVILDMWERHVNFDAVAICALLSFNPDAETVFKDKLVSARRWFLDFAAEYAVYWQTSEATHRTEAAQAALLEWSDFTGRTASSCFDRMEDDVRMLRAGHSTRGTQFDPRTAWRLYLQQAPVIFHAAIALLSVAGSEAAVERTFSAQGLVHSSRRSRLADEAVEAEMFIKFNQRVVAAAEERGRSGTQQQQERRKPYQGHCVEMVEDYDEDTEIPNIADAFQRPVSEVNEEAAAAEENAAMAEDRAEQQEEEKQDEAAQPGSISAVLPAPPVDDVQAFIRYYVSTHGVTATWRWNQDRMNQLMVEAQGGHAEGQGWTGAELRDTDKVLKEKIMQYVRGEDVLLEAHGPC